MNDSEQPRDNQFPLTNNAPKGASSFDAKPAATPASPSAGGKKTARPRNAWTYVKWGIMSVVSVGALAAGIAFGYLYHNSKEIKDITSTFLGGIGSVVQNRDLTAPWTPENQHLLDKGNTLNILILGCDHDYDDRTQQPIKTTPGRSDSILLAHVDFEKQTIKCLTIPRDTAVHIPDHRGLHKINAAHEFGDNELTIRTIKERFGLDTDHYVTLDFESFQKVVNALGGVDVEVKKALNYDDNWGNLHIHLKPGPQHLNGYQAMGYVRMRHSDSDLARSERQHEFLEAIRSKVGPGIIPKLPAILTAITSDLHSDLTQDQMIALANFARKLKPEQIQLITLPNYEGRSYCYIYQDRARKVIADLFYEGNEAMVQLDTPSWEQVASLNSSRGLNSSGEAGGGEGFARRRRSRRAAETPADASAPRDDEGNVLPDSKDSSETATDLTPADHSSDETVSDGKHSRRKRHADTGDASGDTPRSKDKDGSGDAGSKDGPKDSGDKGESGSKDTGSKSDGGGDKGGDKSGGAGDKNGSGDKGDTSGDGASGTL